jgi:hypothetical protein
MKQSDLVKSLDPIPGGEGRGGCQLHEALLNPQHRELASPVHAEGPNTNNNFMKIMHPMLYAAVFSSAIGTKERTMCRGVQRF